MLLVGVRAALDHQEGGEDAADEGAADAHEDVHGDGVALEGPVDPGVEAGLGKVDEAGDADEGAVNATKRGEAEDLGCVVPGREEGWQVSRM